MSIIDAEIDKEYMVKRLHTQGALRQRLISFGILKGAKIKYLNHTALKKTMEIRVGKMNIALREEEAAKIEVVPA